MSGDEIAALATCTALAIVLWAAWITLVYRDLKEQERDE